MGPGTGPLLHSLLLLALGVLAGLQLSYSREQLEGFVGESVYFPALRPVAGDIVRILWFSGKQGTHIAEAKPESRAFRVNYVPYFSNRLAINAGNLSLELRGLRPEDQGPYRAVVDISSDPSHPKTFSYELSVRGRRQEGGRSEGGAMGTPAREEWRTMMEPPTSRDPITTGGKGGKPTAAGGDGGEPEGGESWRTCHCSLKGYLIAAVYGPLCIAVAVVHLKTRG
ncbi:uncharacterized protein LOC102463311 [Pelodiscus sinensis]|uniref:uncharacterized protein LOC102463311 n=1 Tax=Pelodiscus sinensis TaxID=13735 RepID=UPI003F6C2661